MTDRDDVADDTGFLAIWSDVAPEHETDYLHWLTREHVHERLGVDGFLGVTVFRALRSDICRYFIRYRLRDAGVLSSAAYLARLNAPTPWSQRIMPVLQNFVRGGGDVRQRHRIGVGGAAAILQLDTVPPPELIRELSGMDRIVAAELLATDTPKTTIATRERSLRAGDTSFAFVLLLEGLSESSVAAALATIKSSEASTYRLTFHLDAG